MTTPCFLPGEDACGYVQRLAERRWNRIRGASRSRWIGPDDLAQEVLFRLWRQFGQVGRIATRRDMAMAVRSTMIDLLYQHSNTTRVLDTFEVPSEERPPAWPVTPGPERSVSVRLWAQRLHPQDQRILQAVAKETARAASVTCEYSEGRCSTILKRLRTEAEQACI